MQRVCLSPCWINLPYPPVAKDVRIFFSILHIGELRARRASSSSWVVSSHCFACAYDGCCSGFLSCTSRPLYYTLSFRGVEQNTERDTQHRASSKRRDPDRLSTCKTPADQYQVGTQHHSRTAEQSQPTLRQLTRRTHTLSLRENCSHTLCTGGTPKRWKSIGQDLSTGTNLSCCFLRLCRAH